MQQHLQRLAHADLSGLKENIGEYLVGQIQDRFDQQRLWDGSAMKQSAAAKERGGQTLIRRRLLYKSYVYNVTSDGVEVGSNSAYARIHHFGGNAGRGGKTKIDARPVLGINDADEIWIGDLMMNELRGLE
nr:phage virion morphogenesis protein [Collimonas antrihumi]